MLLATPLVCTKVDAKPRNRGAPTARYDARSWPARKMCCSTTLSFTGMDRLRRDFAGDLIKDPTRNEQRKFQ